MVLLWLLLTLHVAEANGEDEPCYQGPDDLFEWIRYNGGFVDDRLELSVGPDPSWKVRGLFAKAPVRKGEKIASVPLELSIDGTLCTLARILMQKLAKGRCSPHWPYLKSFLDYKPSMPETWTLEERAMLNGLPFEPGFIGWEGHAVEYEARCGLPLTPEETPMHQVVVARMNPSESDKISMTPFQDMINHHPNESKQVRGHYVRGQIAYFAGEDVGRGQQFWSFFGVGPERMLNTFGFIEQLPRTWSKPVKFTVGSDGEVTLDQYVDSEIFASEVRNLLAKVDIVVSGPSTQHADVARAYRKIFVDDLKTALDSAMNGSLLTEIRVQLSITNPEDHTASVFWLNGDDRVFVLDVPPKGDARINTFYAHRFEAVYESGQTQKYSVTTAPEQNWILPAIRARDEL